MRDRSFCRKAMMSVKYWRRSESSNHFNTVTFGKSCVYATLFAVSVCRLVLKVKALQVAERELEQQRKQHHVAMDKLLLQVQSLENALKTERHVVTEEKWVQHSVVV